MVRLNANFAAFIADGRAVNPVSKANWEGVGVRPDVAVPRGGSAGDRARPGDRGLDREGDGPGQEGRARPRACDGEGRAPVLVADEVGRVALACLTQSGHHARAIGGRAVLARLPLADHDAYRDLDADDRLERRAHVVVRRVGHLPRLRLARLVRVRQLGDEREGGPVRVVDRPAACHGRGPRRSSRSGRPCRAPSLPRTTTA